MYDIKFCQKFGIMFQVHGDTIELAYPSIMQAVFQVAAASCQ